MRSRDLVWTNHGLPGHQVVAEVTVWTGAEVAPGLGVEAGLVGEGEAASLPGGGLEPGSGLGHGDQGAAG